MSGCCERECAELRATVEGLGEQLRQAEKAADEAHAQADELRRTMLDETYRPEGGEIVMRELRAAKRKAEGLGEKIRVLEAHCELAHEMVTVELVRAKHGHREGPTGTPKYAAFLAALRGVLEGGDPPKPEPVEWP